MRFARSLGTAFVLVLLVGAAVVLATGGVTGATPPSGDALGVSLAQAEDAEPAETEASEAGPSITSPSPVEALLERLSPASDAVALPSAQRVVLSRDPFQPVVPEPASDGTDGGTDGETDGSSDSGTDGTDGGTEDACTGDESETVCDGIVVTLDGFTDEGRSIVTVDGTSFTVAVGDEFATSFRVLAINEPCATLLFGDEAFSICTGATVLK